MQIINPSVEIMTDIDQKAVMEHLERCGRVCYKSEGRIEEGSAERFLAGIINRGHEAVLEHYAITVRFIVDRGVSHEIVRHRLASYCQESTRYCNYSGDQFGREITVIRPCYLSEFGTEREREAYSCWWSACREAEREYFAMLETGCTPQEARAVLPNSLKTELIMTANIREWRHFLKLRTSRAAHPQMREAAEMLLLQLKQNLPALFGDIVIEQKGENR